MFVNVADKGIEVQILLAQIAKRKLGIKNMKMQTNETNRIGKLNQEKLGEKNTMSKRKF